MENLFGEEVKPSPEVINGRKKTQQRGYAWAPGTGAVGETCGTCVFASRRPRWAKCGHEKAPKHTSGKGTDILLRSPACKYWKGGA
jgi:hypothetical protein